MKKFIKVTLIIAGITFVIGLIGTVITVTRAGVIASAELLPYINSILKSDYDFVFELNENNPSIGIGSLNVTAVDEPIDGEITGADISIDAGEVIIKSGSSARISAKTTGDLSYKLENGILYIEDTRENYFFGDGGTGSITITLPDKALDSFNLTVGAGEVELYGISANSGIMKLGAGEISAERLTLGSADVTCGAGEIDIENADLGALSLNCGVGSASISGRIVGRCDIKNGIGETDIEIYGNADDYYFDIKNSIGEMTINDRTISGLGGATTIGSPDAPNVFTIDNGMGEVEIEIHG